MPPLSPADNSCQASKRAGLKRPDAQLAYSFDFAFQNEFTMEENIAIARQFMEENFLSRGMTLNYAIHEPDKAPGGIPNPHIHILAPIRPINPDGTWGNKQKKVPVLDENGERVWDEKYRRWKFTAIPTTDWGLPETLEEWRKNWCDLCNAKFEEKGLDTRIDWHSYERQGVELLAQVHEGPAVRAMEKRGIQTEKGDYNRWVKATNALLKSLREKIAGLFTWIRTVEEKLSEPEQPNLIQILMEYMDLQNAGAENFSRYGRRKTNLTTPQDVAETIAYLRENDITTLEQLEEKLTALRAKVDRLSDSMKAKKRQDKNTERSNRPSICLRGKSSSISGDWKEKVQLQKGEGQISGLTRKRTQALLSCKTDFEGGRNAAGVFSGNR